MPFLHLPNEIIISISHHQSPPDIYALCRANRRLSALLIPELLKSVSARRGDTSSVRVLLKHGITKLLGDTFLHEAVRTEGEIAIKTLLDSGGFNATSTNAKGRAPLCLAVSDGQPAVVGLLLQCPGADVNPRSTGTRWPLVARAAHRGNEKIMRLLLANERLLVNATDLVGVTALTRAALEGRPEIASLLLADPRTDINHRDMWGRTPLLTSCVVGHFAVFKLLLEDPRTEVNAADREGQTPLHCCAERHRSHMVRPLLAHPRIDVNRRDISLCTPLFAAVAGQNTEVARILVADARVNVNTTGEFGQHPLVVAAEKGLSDVAEMLLQREDLNFCALNCN
ncbi:unnamed protein product, partial [Tuber aestivum]